MVTFVAMSASRGFFLSFLLVQVMAGMIFIVSENMVALFHLPALEVTLRFYLFHVSPVIHILTALSALVIFWGAKELWKLKKAGFRIYMTGKILLGILIIYSIAHEYLREQINVPWQTILVYAVMWSVFPFLFLLQRKKLNH
jgi:hypothetical protein